MGFMPLDANWVDDDPASKNLAAKVALMREQRELAVAATAPAAINGNYESMSVDKPVASIAASAEDATLASHESAPGGGGQRSGVSPPEASVSIFENDDISKSTVENCEISFPDSVQVSPKRPTADDLCSGDTANKSACINESPPSVATSKSNKSSPIGSSTNSSLNYNSMPFVPGTSFQARMAYQRPRSPPPRRKVTFSANAYDRRELQYSPPTSPVPQRNGSNLAPNVKQLFDLVNSTVPTVSEIPVSQNLPNCMPVNAAPSSSSASEDASPQANAAGRKSTEASGTSITIHVRPFEGSWERKNRQAEPEVPPLAAVDANEPVPMRLARLFLQIDNLLPSLERSMPQDRSREYYMTRMSQAEAAIKKLYDFIDLPELTDGNYARMTDYISRLQEYIDLLDRMFPVKYQIDLAMADGLFRSDLLEPFDGDILNWPGFWATYNELVASNSLLTDSSKYFLLYNNLDEKTRLLVASINPATPQLRFAYRKLLEFFNNHDNILFGLCTSLKKLPNVKNSYLMENWTRMMRSAQLAKRVVGGRPDRVELEKECVIILLGKLSPKHTDEFFKQPGADWRLECFVDYAKMRMIRLERMMYLGADLSNTAQMIPDVMCRLCKKDYHFPENCEFTLEERKEKAKSERLCNRCLAEEYFHGHFCGVTCAHCGGDHHLALCYSYRPTSQPNKYGPSYIGPQRVPNYRSRDTHQVVLPDDHQQAPSPFE